jgi:multiple sugar transport system ATP-binding protein
MGSVVLENVTKRFGGDAAVEDLSLEIEAGDFFSLVGPSGCGKTTTMRMIAGLEQPDEGRIWIDGTLVSDSRDLTMEPAHRRRIGLVFQNYALWPHMSVRDNVLFGLRLQKLPRDEQERRLANVLELLQIRDFRGRYPNELSGGQQQRVALARELVLDVRVLMLDEPLSNLDAQLRLEMRTELKRLHQETGQTIIYVTHDQIEALTLSTRVALMKDGVVQQCASPDELYFSPDNLFVAAFIGNVRINLLDATLDADVIEATGLRLPRPPDVPAPPAAVPVTLGVRPEQVSLARSADIWCVPGKAESVLPMGSTALVQVRLGRAGDGAVITVQHDRSWNVAHGDDVLVRLPPKALHLFDAATAVRYGAAGGVPAGEARPVTALEIDP